MSSKRHMRRKACDGKERYETQTAAVASLISLKKAGGESIATYRCRFCGGWHVGHRVHNGARLKRLRGVNKGRRRQKRPSVANDTHHQ